MREADLAGPRRRAAAHERERRSGVMWRAEGPRAQQWMPRIGESRDAVHRARGEGFVVVEREGEHLQDALSAHQSRQRHGDVANARHFGCRRTHGQDGALVDGHGPAVLPVRRRDATD